MTTFPPPAAAPPATAETRPWPSRILLASSERGLYGGERQLLLLARELTAAGRRLQVLARADGALLAASRDAGLAVDVLDPSPSPRNLLSLRRRIAAFRPDVLHANDPRALTSANLAAVGLAVGLRSVARRVGYPLRSPRAYRWLAEVVLCVSEAVIDRCRRDGLPADRLRLVRDAVDPARVVDGDGARVREELALGAAPVLLCVAALEPDKGHDVLLAALPAVWAQHPEVRLLLAGDGAQRPSLEAAAEADPRVRVLGYREDVADLLAAADLVVLPSLDEGFGSALAEAAIAGVPTVASAVGGVPELLADEGDGAAGWLVPPDDPAALARATLAALADSGEAAARAARARERARARNTPAAMLEGTLTAWRASRTPTPPPP